MPILRGKSRTISIVGAVTLILVIIAGTLVITQRTQARSQGVTPFSTRPSAQGTVPLAKTVNMSSVPNVLPAGNQKLPNLSYASPAQTTQIKKAAVQSATASSAQVAPQPSSASPETPSTFGLIQGQSEVGTTAPSDMGLAVGNNYIVQVVNATFAMYTLSGTKVYGPRAYYAFLNLPNNSSMLFHPRALYDAAHGRFIILMDDVEGAPFTTNPQNSIYHIAVSQTNNPLGLYYLYDYSVGQNLGTASATWANTPQMGIDSQGLYFTGNSYGFSSQTFAGSFLFAVNLAQLESGSASHFFKYTNLQDTDGSAYGVAPAVTYGTPRAEFMVDTDVNVPGDYTVWSLSNPFSVGGSYTPVLERYTFTGPMFSTPPEADQPSGANTIGTDDTSVSGQAVFRGGLLYFAATTGFVNPSANTVAAVNWFEVQPVLSLSSTNCSPNADCSDLSSASIYDDNTIGYDMTTSAYDPSIGVDTDGNFFLDYTVSSLTSMPSGVISSHRITDPLHTTSDAVTITGSTSAAYYSQTLWGGYSAMALDPASCNATTPIAETCYRVWFSGMDVLSTGSWGTYISADTETISQA